MYSVVEIAGHQYNVAPGKLIDVDKLQHSEGATIDLDKVLFVGGEAPIIGKPFINGAVVKAKVIRHAKDKKILMVKRMRGKWQKKRGHRQQFTCLLITEIIDGKGNSSKIDLESTIAKKHLSAAAAVTADADTHAVAD
ncbi:MAG: 50S ribosomal protein L21 [Oligoflexia bacterium]|nr:50S ribosomal protein L21 [Oligoflexia bacterium]